MAKLTVSQWDIVAANNTDINSIPIDGAVTTPSQVDNIVREMMAQIKTFSTSVTLTVGTSVDNTVPRFDGVAGALQTSGITIADDNSITSTSSSQFAPQIYLENTYNGAGSGYLNFRHSRGAGAAVTADPMGGLVGQARATNLAWASGASLGFDITSVGASTIDGKITFGTTQSTVQATKMTLQNGLAMANATGGDKGVGTVNATVLYFNGQSIATDTMSGFIGAPANKSYTLVLKCPYGGTINETVTICASGTCTATFKINGTPLGGTANSVSSSEQTQAQASANTFAAGDDIVVTISANSSCVDMAFTLKVTKSF